MTRNFEVKGTKKDYEILEKYGFDFEKNFEQIIKNVAKELREYEKEK